MAGVRQKRRAVSGACADGGVLREKPVAMAGPDHRDPYAEVGAREEGGVLDSSWKLKGDR